MSGLERAHRLVGQLVTPAELPPVASSLEQPPRNWFLSILETKNREYMNSVDGAIQLTGDVSFDFVRCCVNSLVNLKLELDKAVAAEAPKKAGGGPRLEPDALSISQQKNVHSLTEMIVSLGLLPNLLPGIGLPPDKRSHFLQSILMSLPSRPILEQYRQLVFSLDVLLELTRQRSLATLILTRHLGDLLAALIQLAYAPLLKPSTTEEERAKNTSKDEEEDKKEAAAVLDKFVMTEELFQRLIADQAKYTAELTAIVERTYQPTIVRHLLVLQSNSTPPPSKRPDKKTTTKKGAAATPSPPKWFARRVGELLSGRLLAGPNGVAHVIRGVLDMGDVPGAAAAAAADAPAMDWTKIELVATVLASPPEGSYASVEAYYAKVCPQILRLISDSEDKIFQMIACAAVRTMAERSLILSRRYLLDVLMTPFLRLAAIDKGDDDIVTASEEESALPTEEELDACLKTLYKVFVIGNDPSMMFVAHLGPIILILLELHSAISLAGVSHLVGPVRQLVHRYLKHSDRATAVATVRAFAFSEVPSTAEARLGRIKVMNQDLVFTAGEEGGVKVQPKVLAEQHSFYVSDDEKAIVIQDLLEELKDRQLATDFFLGLMHDLTDMMVEGEAEEEEEVDLPPLQPGQDLAKQLREMELQLDRTMAKMRRNLMVIRLLGLLSEDTSLQDSLLAESNRMIDFIGETIKRAAVSVRKAGPSPPATSPSMMAVQSLNMALSILSLHLTQKNIQMSDWEKMQAYTDDLNCLTLHADQRIAKIAGQLYRLVLTHGTIIRENENIRRHTRRIEEETEKMRAKAAELKQLKRSQEDQQLDQKKEQLRIKAEELRKAKEERRNRRPAKDEEEAPELKIIEDKTGMTPFEAAVYDVSDPLLPVRGHGIIELGRLVDTKDEETLSQVERVLTIFRESLEEEDTYIYLSAINGLVACARHQTGPVLDILSREFSLVADRSKLMEAAADQNKTMEIRTKVGEALVRATKELGDLTPAYKNLLLNTFFGAASDPEGLVRASSLSNLGEVCRNLRYSLGSVAGELLLHLEQASRDVCVEVRRAAAMVLSMTLEGLGRDAFRVLESCLRDVYRALRLRQSVEQDEVTLTHIGLALAEIDAIVRQLFTPRPELEKKIYVLDAPPDLF